MQDKLIGNENNILFYNDEEGNIKVEVLLKNEDVWLNTEALATLFNIDRSGIVRHIKNIYNDKELEENSTCAKIAQVQKEGNREVKRVYPYYNLDMIISIGFRVNSKKAIKFRTWANKVIKDYMVQGFALNDERFMKARKTDQEYFQRLLERKTGFDHSWYYFILRCYLRIEIMIATRVPKAIIKESASKTVIVSPPLFAEWSGRLRQAIS